jgi:hypothetical protein
MQRLCGEECVYEVYPDGTAPGNKMAQIVTVSGPESRRPEQRGENVVHGSMSFEF